MEAGMKDLKKLAAVCYLAGSFMLNAAVLGFLACNIIERYPGNHVGIDPWRRLSVIPLLTVGSIVAPWFMRPKLALAVTGIWIVYVCALGAFDLFSVMLEHGVWCARGMPEWGTPIWETRLFEETSR